MIAPPPIPYVSAVIIRGATPGVPMAKSSTSFGPNNHANDAGRAKKKNSIREQLRFISGLKPEEVPKVPFSYAQRLAIKRIKACESEDMSGMQTCIAIDRLTDQIDGKPKETVEHQGDPFTESFNAWVAKRKKK